MHPKLIAQRLKTAGIDNAEALAGLAIPSVRITTTRTSLTSLEMGVSRFGGVPDVPADFLWPMRAGQPLTFLAQIDLTEARVPGLPPAGWLCFFYDVIDQPWGFDPKDAGGAAVVYFDVERTLLVRAQHPPTERGPFQPCSLAFAPRVDLPDPWDSLMEHHGLEIGREQGEAYEEVARSLAGEPEEPYHHLLGHPQCVQADMRGECELVSNGIYCGGPGAYRGPRAATLLARAPTEWQLLLQIDSDSDGPDWMWGDMGRLYYWMRRSDLAARAFDRAWLVLQCG